MNSLTVISQVSGMVIGRKIVLAETFLTRLKGLLGRKEFNIDEGLLIKPCNCVHSFGMKFAIDVIFLDSGGRVLTCFQNLKPNKISPSVKGAKMVLELPAGSIVKYGLKEKDILEISNS